jgi:hypothetical protein
MCSMMSMPSRTEPGALSVWPKMMKPALWASSAAIA